MPLTMEMTLRNRPDRGGSWVRLRILVRRSSTSMSERDGPHTGWAESYIDRQTTIGVENNDFIHWGFGVRFVSTPVA